MNIQRQRRTTASLVLGLISAFTVGSYAVPTYAAGVNFAREPACSSLVPVSQGGPAPRDPNLLVLRWLGVSNEELAYRSNVILIDAYYSRVPPARPLGFDRSAVKNATAILVDHAHSDHFADVPFVAAQTHAPVYGAPVSIETAIKFGVPAAQTHVVTGKGGELLRFDGLTVEPVLALHVGGDPQVGEINKLGWGQTRMQMEQIAGLAPTAQQQAALHAEMAIGSRDPRVITEGDIGFLFSFPTGYKIYYRDAGGIPTQYERALEAKIGRPDVGIFSYTSPLPDFAIMEAMRSLDLFKPRIFIPIHHDDVGGTRLETPVEPIAMAIRDKFPGSRTISPLYRTPVCIDVKTKQVSVGP